MVKKSDDMFCQFDTIPVCDRDTVTDRHIGGQTDRQTDIYCDTIVRTIIARLKLIHDHKIIKSIANR